MEYMKSNRIRVEYDWAWLFKCEQEELLIDRLRTMLRWQSPLPSTRIHAANEVLMYEQLFNLNWKMLLHCRDLDTFILLQSFIFYFYLYHLNWSKTIETFLGTALRWKKKSILQQIPSPPHNDNLYLLTSALRCTACRFWHLPSVSMYSISVCMMPLWLAIPSYCQIRVLVLIRCLLFFWVCSYFLLVEPAW